MKTMILDFFRAIVSFIQANTAVAVPVGVHAYNSSRTEDPSVSSGNIKQEETVDGNITDENDFIDESELVTPTPEPTPEVTATPEPEQNVTPEPTVKPTNKPTAQPTAKPTAKPTAPPAFENPDNTAKVTPPTNIVGGATTPPQIEYCIHCGKKYLRTIEWVKTGKDPQYCNGTCHIVWGE